MTIFPPPPRLMKCFAAACAREERRLQVRRQGLVPIFLGEFLGRREQLHARVVNENMQVAEVLDDIIDEFAQRGDAAQVDGVRFGASALCLGRLYGLIQRSLFTRSDRDVGAGVGECVYDRASDAAASAGDDCDFPRKAEFVHGRSSVLIMLRQRPLCGAGDKSRAALPLTV